MKKVIVIGAGVLGSSISYQLAKRGVDVTVIDKGIPGDAASSASFAWLNSTDKAKPVEHHYLNAMSIGEWNLIAREIGTSNWLQREGNLQVADTAEDVEELEALVQQCYSLGYAAVPIDPKDLHRVDPLIKIRPEYKHAVFFPDEGHITIPLLVHDLLRAASGLGATVRHSTTVTNLVQKDDRISGVVLEDGETLNADLVVLAAGAGIGELLSKQGVDANTQGQPGITVTTSPGASHISTMLHLPGLSVRPDTSGRIVVRSSAADAAIDLEAWTLPESATQELFRQAAEGISDFDAASVRAERVQIAYRPYPLDGLPVIGNWQGLPGLYVSTMHSGVTLGAIAGRLVAEEITTNEVAPILDGFRPSRLIAAMESGEAFFDPYAFEREKRAQA